VTSRRCPASATTYDKIKDQVVAKQAGPAKTKETKK
jgi:hypothetical protein